MVLPFLYNYIRPKPKCLPQYINFAPVLLNSKHMTTGHPDLRIVLRHTLLLPQLNYRHTMVMHHTY